jgi:hypothetical protein
MAAYLQNDLGLLGNLPWGTTRQDARAASKLLIIAGIDRTSALGAEVLAMLCQRISECRDLFVLRGARTNSLTVLQMAGRSLARDAEQAKRLDAVVSGRGRSLLQALSSLIEQVARQGAPAAAQRKPTVARAKLSPVRTAPIQADRIAPPAPVGVTTLPRLARPVRSPANDDFAPNKSNVAAA